MRKWLALGRRESDGVIDEVKFDSAQAATKFGRDQIAVSLWRSFRVAKVTASYVRGAVRVK